MCRKFRERKWVEKLERETGRRKKKLREGKMFREKLKESFGL